MEGFAMVTPEERITRLEAAQEFNTQQFAEVLSRLNLIISIVEASRQEAREANEIARREAREMAESARRGAREMNEIARREAREMVESARREAREARGSAIGRKGKSFRWWNPFDVMGFIAGNDKLFYSYIGVMTVIAVGTWVTALVMFTKIVERLPG